MLSSRITISLAPWSSVGEFKDSKEGGPSIGTTADDCEGPGMFSSHCAVWEPTGGGGSCESTGTGSRSPC